MLSIDLGSYGVANRTKLTYHSILRNWGEVATGYGFQRAAYFTYKPCRSHVAGGTAGFAAELAIARMEREGLAPGNGPITVTGATGGVGSIAVDILSALGYAVVAVTGKESEAGYRINFTNLRGGTKWTTPLEDEAFWARLLLQPWRSPR
jgi:hypothetical protein